MIIDIHAHIKRDKLTKRYLEEDLLKDMTEYDIDRRVVSALEGKSIEDQNNYVSDLVMRYPDKLIGCAVINPKEDDCVAETERALNLPGIRCVEFNSLEHGYFPEQCENINEVLKVIEKYNVPVKMFTGMGAMTMPQQWAIYAKKFPKINFIMLHIGCFDFGYSCVDVARVLDNVYVETSNQYEVQILNKAFTQLPKHKIIFGSMYPERLTKNAIDVFEMFNLDESLLKSIYYENAQRLLLS